jgi:hypothetical protein
VSLGHALAEHEIGRHSPLGSGVIPANLLDRSRVVVGLAQPLRQRHAAPAQENDRCESGYRASAPTASDHRHFTNFCFFARTGLPCQSRRALYFRARGTLRAASCSARLRGNFGTFQAQVRSPPASEPASLILIAQGTGSTAVSPDAEPIRRGTTKSRGKGLNDLAMLIARFTADASAATIGLRARRCDFDDLADHAECIARSRGL